MNKKQVTHIVIVCNDCEKEFTDYSNAKEIAMKHADKMGHSIQGEISIHFHYKGKKNGNK